jgi:hypothetical protein
VFRQEAFEGGIVSSYGLNAGAVQDHAVVQAGDDAATRAGAEMGSSVSTAAPLQSATNDT